MKSAFNYTVRQNIIFFILICSKVQHRHKKRIKKTIFILTHTTICSPLLYFINILKCLKVFLLLPLLSIFQRLLCEQMMENFSVYLSLAPESKLSIFFGYYHSNRFQWKKFFFYIFVCYFLLVKFFLFIASILHDSSE